MEALPLGTPLSDSIFDALGALVVVMDANANVLSFNRKAEEVSGMQESEVLGKSIFVTVPPELHGTALDFLEKLRQGQPYHREENDWFDRQGRRRRMKWCNTAVRGPAGEITYFISTAIDITEMHELQERLAQSQKLESIGRLAGGVAHDYNNILTIIQGYAERALMFVDPESRARRELQRLTQAVARGSRITQQLLAFARKQPSRLTPLNLNELSSHMATLLDDVLGPKLKIETHFQTDCRDVMGDRSQLEQIFMNLTLNARDAMPDGGRIEVRTRSLPLDEERARVLQVQPGLYTILQVKDHGHGIPAHQLDKVFEPFFTTKQQGNGSGLGLAVCEGIARQSRGAIEVESQLGQGSTFTVYLPAH